MKPQKTKALQAARAVVQAKINWQHPVYLIHAVTARCNAKCEFCAWRFYEDFSGELTTQEIKKLYTDARRAGFLALSVWGGEPLVHRDIGEILEHAQNLGFATNMVTNGFLLDKKLDAVIPWLDRMCISVDHPSEKHDEIRGVKGLYERILNATRRVRKEYPRKKILYNYTMYKNNIDIDSLEKMARLAKSLGVNAVFNPLRDETASGDAGAVDLKKFVASDAEISEAFSLIKRLKKRGYPILNSFTYINHLRKGPPEYHCHWPKFILPIEANGDVVDCMHWGSRPMDNVKGKPFSEVLRNPRLRELAGAEGESCHKCVSIHRVEISEIWEGNLEPLLSWGARLL